MASDSVIGIRVFSVVDEQWMGCNMFGRIALLKLHVAKCREGWSYDSVHKSFDEKCWSWVQHAVFRRRCTDDLTKSLPMLRALNF